MISWAKMKDIELQDEWTFFREHSQGVYTLKMKRCYLKETETKGLAFIAEQEVVRSTNDAHPIGSSVTTYIGMTNKAIALPRVKRLIAAYSGVSPKTPAYDRWNTKIDETMKDVVGEKNSLEGAFADCEVSLTEKEDKTYANADFRVCAKPPRLPYVPEDDEPEDDEPEDDEPEDDEPEDDEPEPGFEYHPRGSSAATATHRRVPGDVGPKSWIPRAKW